MEYGGVVVKKMILWLMFATLILSLTSCFSDNSESSSANIEEELVVSLIIPDQLGDKAFFDSAHVGMLRAEKDLDVVYKMYESNHDRTLYSEQLIEASEESDVVIALGYEFYDLVKEVSQTYEDKIYLYVDDVLEGYNNITSLTFGQDEGAFLAGAFGALMTKETQIDGINELAIIGMVGGRDIPVIRDFQKGYEAGAKYIDPSIEVLTVFSGDFTNTEKCREKAAELYQQGADIVFAVAGGAGIGVFDAAEENGGYAIGVDSDQRYINPDVILASMVKNVGNSIYDTLIKIQNEESVGGVLYTFGLKETGVDFTYGDDTMEVIVPDAIRKHIEEIRQDLIEGRISID